jgi:hypothetical protein
VRKGDYAGLCGFFGESAAFLAAGGRAAAMVSVLLAVDPLEQDVEQEVTAKNANRQKYGKRHGDLTRADVNGAPGRGNDRGGKAKKS